jgi:hypothetical protein
MKELKMEKFVALGTWVGVETKNIKKEEKIDENGLWYKESQLDDGIIIKSTVYSVGPDVPTGYDLRVGDNVYWKLGCNDGAHWKSEDKSIILDVLEINDILVVEERGDEVAA